MTSCVALPSFPVIETGSGSGCQGQSRYPRTRPVGKKPIRTGPGTARKSKSVLEMELEPPKAVCQF